MNFHSNNLALNRLISEYEEHKRLILAIDFDNTIYDCHNRGLDFHVAFDLIKKARKVGFEIYCFTANIDHNLVKHICAKDLGIRDIKVNECSLDSQFDSRKPFYSLLLDDRAGLKESLELLTSVLEYIEDTTF